MSQKMVNPHNHTENIVNLHLTLICLFSVRVFSISNRLSETALVNMGPVIKYTKADPMSYMQEFVP